MPGNDTIALKVSPFSHWTTSTTSQFSDAPDIVWHVYQINQALILLLIALIAIKFGTVAVTCVYCDFMLGVGRASFRMQTRIFFSQHRNHPISRWNKWPILKLSKKNQLKATSKIEDIIIFISARSNRAAKEPIYERSADENQLHKLNRW